MSSSPHNQSSPSPVPGSRRGQPGRPRKGDAGIYGHSPGTPTAEQRTRSGDFTGAPVVITSVSPIAPRLLDLAATAAYLGVSTWKIRELDAEGILPRVRIPLPNAGEVRKLLFDRCDLDLLIQQWKDLAKTDGGRGA
ncbi:MAG: hypothetical protein Nkreftii_002698 [Candidatus Nitrospira kreftii]|uniref:Helix-turn-helix domain-containing protein n=1 Tax=Candidatus Nitrospira kreftii TaxID=2652173 RepID=A0A7S8FF70_9BACT|nr:MAG: hypothetical protein Nkreftii_002698 [Candidatus Nitrospira kreftii]